MKERLHPVQLLSVLYSPFFSFFSLAVSEAAKIVFSSAVPLVMVGLDIGWKAVLKEADVAQMPALGKTGAMLYALFQKYKSKTFGGLGIYDACTIAYVLKPDLFQTQTAFLILNYRGK